MLNALNLDNQDLDVSFPTVGFIVVSPFCLPCVSCPQIIRVQSPDGMKKIPATKRETAAAFLKKVQCRIPNSSLYCEIHRDQCSSLVTFLQMLTSLSLHSILSTNLSSCFSEEVSNCKSLCLKV